ncbi:hypothetical protein [Pseudomonas sp. zfem003]|uniref:hypothetical protein n=1 Tax=Pseudomonas sp. zfem003 TaxID=3078198 RepID=UPI00292817FE|nr:hypothetical protein [Pseudomonas sp. zfem003]MDU9399267.1 hypothetical protein [Pseudomonas sp. zfem003]
MQLAKHLQAARRRQYALSLTNERQIQLGQSFNQRAKFAVWDRRTDLGETVWPAMGELRRAAQ